MSFPATCTFPVAGEEQADTYTNAQKLSLPANTAAGTKVKVSDGFILAGESSPLNGFYYPVGTQNGRPEYQTAGSIPDGYATLHWTGTEWTTGNVLNADGDTAYPWLADWSGVDITLTHPAVQQLAAPSTAQGGVFVSGGTQDGVFLKVGTLNSKAAFGLLGVNTTDPIEPSFDAITWSGTQWEATNDNSELIYYSLSNVATPDLASNWKNASDDSPASITVTSVSVGQIAAGIQFGSDFYAITAPVNGRNAYHDVLGVAPDFTFNGTIWTDGTHNGTGTPAFPWDVTGITITRDDVCSETNWVDSSLDNIQLFPATASFAGAAF